MSKFDGFVKKKLAFALAVASVLGGKTSAVSNRNNNVNINNTGVKSSQTLGAVGGAANKNSSNKFVNWVAEHKLGVGITGILTVTTAVTLTILGVKHLGKKDNGGGPNKNPNTNNPEKNNPEKGSREDPKVAINQTKAQTTSPAMSGKENTQVQNKNKDDANPNPNPNLIPVVQPVVPKERPIIDKNIDQIKRQSDKEITAENFKSFFGKVKIILDNKDKLVANMVEEVLRLNSNTGRWNTDDDLCEDDVNDIIKRIVENTIECLYNEEGVDSNSKLYVWSGGRMELSLNVFDSKFISIGEDGVLYFRNGIYGVRFKKDLGITLNLVKN